ncbi:hypothetical protein ACI2JA_03405 [Alkalihalobacillus sp. NPDC078783]
MELEFYPAPANDKKLSLHELQEGDVYIIGIKGDTKKFMYKNKLNCEVVQTSGHMFHKGFEFSFNPTYEETGLILTSEELNIRVKKGSW